MNNYKKLTGNFFAKRLAALRARMRLTQEEMAERLRITSRAYRELESGRSACSGPTLMFILSMMNDSELNGLLRDFLSEVAQFEGGDIA